nr:toprim domain-containing protein [uncultured Rhodopila sp.]
MTDQLVITERTSQANDVRAAVGPRYGTILPAEGHLFDLLEPEDVVPAWKRWQPILLRPEGLYGTKPASGGNKAAKLKAIRDALQRAGRVWLACDRLRPGGPTDRAGDPGVRIPTHPGHLFQLDGGHRSDLMAATIPN